MDTKKTVCHIGKKMAMSHFIAGCDGNISFRRPDGKIVITPSGYPKGELKASQLLLLDAEGHLLKGKGRPSTETNLHLQIYKSRADVNAIIHAHPTISTAVTVAGLKFPSHIVTEGRDFLGPVRTIPYEAPGSIELALACADGLKEVNAVLLERHGAAVVGTDLSEALYRLETLEAVAKIYRDSLIFAGTCPSDSTSLAVKGSIT